VSADVCIAYYGIRHEVSADAITTLEMRSDARLVVARKIGLKTYWGNFGAPGERHLLFIGAELGVLGPENLAEVRFGSADLQKTFQETSAKLRSAGFDEEGQLYLQWMADA
jgi:hypothetical protein